MASSEGNSVSYQQLHAALTGPRPTGTIIQDFCPAYDCVDWQLSRRYWDHRGPDAFLGGDVPYIVTNDGYLAGNAVAVLLASCEAAVEKGTLEDTIRVLELGAGSGLFAKQFLDQLQRSDAAHAQLVYDRLVYTVTDGSDTMISAMQERGIFADHADHVVCLPARAPGIADMLGAGPHAGQYRAVFTNYLLDSLPFTILSLLGDEVFELRLRTSIAKDVELSQYTTLGEDEIVARLNGDDAAGLAGLSGLYPALAIDAEYVRVERADLPLPDAIPVARDRADGPLVYLHSYGALASVDEALDLLRPDGVMLASDYGFSGKDEDRPMLEFQHFGGSVAIGLNFEALGRVFGTEAESQVIAPDSDTDHLLSRMIAHAPAQQAIDVFRTRYSRATWDRLTKPLHEAQKLVSEGQIEAARWQYEEAMRFQPQNWAVLEEIAGFICYHLQDYEAALTMARAVLELNHLSPGAWNIVGDCFFYTDHLAQAAEAYEKGANASPKDVRSMLNLAWVAVHAEQPDQALEYIAKGLAFDVTGAFRDALLAKQEQVLDRQADKHRMDMMRGQNRIRGHANLPGRSDAAELPRLKN